MFIVYLFEFTSRHHNIFTVAVRIVDYNISKWRNEELHSSPFNCLLPYKRKPFALLFFLFRSPMKSGLINGSNLMFTGGIQSPKWNEEWNSRVIIHITYLPYAHYNSINERAYYACKLNSRVLQCIFNDFLNVPISMEDGCIT